MFLRPLGCTEAKLPCCPSKQGDLSENFQKTFRKPSENLFNKLPPQTVHIERGPMWRKCEHPIKKGEGSSDSGSAAVRPSQDESTKEEEEEEEYESEAFSIEGARGEEGADDRFVRQGEEDCDRESSAVGSLEELVDGQVSYVTTG